MSEEELQREIVSGAFSMQVADCERNIRIQFEKLQQENQQLKKKYENAVADYEYEKSKNQRAIEYMEQWGKEPDADMYMQMKDYNEFKYLLKILKEDNKEQNER